MIKNYEVSELVAFRRIAKNWGKFTIYNACNLISLGLYRPIQFLDGVFFKPKFSFTLYDIALIEIANQIATQLDIKQYSRSYRQRDQYGKIALTISTELSSFVIEENTYCVYVIDYKFISFMKFTSKEKFMNEFTHGPQHNYYIFDAVGFIKRLDASINKKKKK